MRSLGILAVAAALTACSEESGTAADAGADAPTDDVAALDDAALLEDNAWVEEVALDDDVPIADDLPPEDVTGDDALDLDAGPRLDAARTDAGRADVAMDARADVPAPRDVPADVARDSGAPIDAGPPFRYGGVSVRRPHWGSDAHGDRPGSTYYTEQFRTWTINRWGGCHATYYYYIDPSFPAVSAAWVTAAINAFAHWDVGAYCAPHWVRTTSAWRASVVVRIASSSVCSGGGVWYACAGIDSRSSTTSQHWTVTLNRAIAWGVGVAGRFDVESVLTNEIGHVLYGGHAPYFNDSVVMANSCPWGATRCTVSCSYVAGFDSYQVCPSDGTCSSVYRLCAPTRSGGCGNRRAILPGDRARLEHIYGRDSTPSHP
ncbi:MAG: hypothetical protein Q8S73_17410 [Deltaproteobacteria bacterium]|nr:hypothetical protein [Deltaproteobacteria bacterium]